MATNWLKDRLSPVKKDTLRWQELAEAIEEFWETYFYPAYENALDLRSIYTADEAGQQRMIGELGKYYENGISDDSRAVAVAMRKIELQSKDTTLLLENYILRKGLTGVEWVPLYAKNADPYGTAFYTEQEIIALGLTPGEGTNYMTSRGRIEYDSASITQEELDDLEEAIKTIKPLHIVFEGMQQRPGYGDNWGENYGN